MKTEISPIDPGWFKNNAQEINHLQYQINLLTDRIAEIYMELANIKNFVVDHILKGEKDE